MSAYPMTAGAMPSALLSINLAVAAALVSNEANDRGSHGWSADAVEKEIFALTDANTIKARERSRLVRGRRRGLKVELKTLPWCLTPSAHTVKTHW